MTEHPGLNICQGKKSSHVMHKMFEGMQVFSGHRIYTSYSNNHKAYIITPKNLARYFASFTFFYSLYKFITCSRY